MTFSIFKMEVTFVNTSFPNMAEGGQRLWGDFLIIFYQQFAGYKNISFTISISSSLSFFLYVYISVCLSVCLFLSLALSLLSPLPLSLSGSDWQDLVEEYPCVNTNRMILSRYWQDLVEECPCVNTNRMILGAYQARLLYSYETMQLGSGTGLVVFYLTPDYYETPAWDQKIPPLPILVIERTNHVTKSGGFNYCDQPEHDQ